MKLNPLAQSKEKAPSAATAGRPELRSSQNNGQRRFLIVLAVGVIVFAITIAGIFGIGLYAFDWNDQVTSAMVRVVPYPAARVDGEFVSYQQYRDDVATLAVYYQNEAVASGGQPTDDEISELVLNRLLRDVVTEREAKGLGIRVSAAEVEARFNEVVADAGSLETVRQTLQELYEWDTTTFKERVIRPFFYRERLQQVLGANQALNQQARQKAEDLLNQLRAGSSFETLAQQNSDDSATAEKGGDLGSFGRGVMVAAFEEAAFALDIGQLSDIVQTPFGYHIIKLEDKRQTTVEGTAVEEIHARHILVATVNVDEWITDQLRQSAVSIFVSPYRWDRATGRVILADQPVS